MKSARSYYLWLGLALIAVLAGGALITLWGARQDRDGRLAQLAAMTERVSSLLDSEIETSEARLIGLSTSPLLQDGDLRGFHQQMLRTPIPPGALLVISDHERQLANSMRPFGTPLPLLSEYTPQPLFFETLETKGVYVSSRIFGRILNSSNVTVSIKVPDAAGRLKYILTTALGEKRLLAVMQSGEQLPAAASLLLIDAMGQHVTDAAHPRSTLTAEALARASGLSLRAVGEGAAGQFRSDDPQPTVTSYDRSPLSGWTVALTVPADSVDQPVSHALRLLGLLALVAAGLLLILFGLFRRRIQQPYENMKAMLTSARSQLDLAISDIADTRTREQTRIAQELHDTTAQRLVAAGLYLDAVERRGTGQITDQLHEARDLIAQSLEELRTLAFLWHSPPAAGGFRQQLDQLFQGFAGRAGLECRVDFPPWLDALPPDSGRALYRVAQEALANIRRHAAARGLSANLRCEAGQVVLTIEDDGCGGLRYPGGDGPARGLGLSGMDRTLSELGGSLRVEPLARGTRLIASLPLPDAPGMNPPGV